MHSQDHDVSIIHWAPSEYRMSGGYALPHRDEMHALVTGHAWSGALIWGKQVDGGWADVLQFDKLKEVVVAKAGGDFSRARVGGMIVEFGDAEELLQVSR